MTHRVAPIDSVFQSQQRSYCRRQTYWIKVSYGLIRPSGTPHPHHLSFDNYFRTVRLNIQFFPLSTLSKSTKMTDTSAATSTTNAVHPNSPHPLQFKWTLWHDVAQKGNKGPYAANLRTIASFDSVEDFWALFNNLKEPSQLVQGNMYNLFKHGIEPKWEDPQNLEGGEWRVTLPASSKRIFDEHWVNTILTVIGEGFGPEESDDIAGIVVNIKRGALRISIWSKTATNESLQMRIGSRWKETANITARMEYFSFNESLTQKRNRPRYIIE